jgi:glycosyltransferase involved in cell wall biosynthesis
VKNKVNIIHSHHRYWDLIAYLVSLFNKVKTVTSVQSKVRGKKLLSYKASKLIAASGVIRDHLIAVFKIRESRIEVINNCVDEGLLNPHVNSISFKQNDIINLGFVGRFNKEKGVDVLLQAYRMLVNERNNYSLTLVGDGEEKSNLESYIKQHNLLVKFVKPVEDVFNYMQMFDIIILPSRVDPFPLVMLEAGIMKKPFIGSNVDGIAELITHEVDGLLVEPEEPIKLKNAILRLADDIELCNKIANSLYLKVSENYTLDKIIPKYKILYKSLINND